MLSAILITLSFVCLCVWLVREHQDAEARAAAAFENRTSLARAQAFARHMEATGRGRWCVRQIGPAQWLAEPMVEDEVQS